MPEAEKLRALLHYDPDTGVFTHLEHTTRRRAGDIAGSKTRYGYVELRFGGSRGLAHRYAFLYMTGEFPAAEVDHINGVRDDNRWCNLRLATRSENQQNLRGAMSNSRSGLLGVSWNKKSNKWWAQIQANNKHRHLGFFADKHEAHAAYLKAKAELHAFSTI